MELSLLQRPGPTIDLVSAARSRRIWRIPDRWYLPRLVPSFRQLWDPGGRRSGLSGTTQSPRGQDNASNSATGVDLGGGNILQFNCNGIRHCHAELQDFLHRNHVQVACLQETKLVPGSALEEFSGYTTVRRDRTTGGGGVMCLVSHSCTFSEWDTTDIITHDGTTEVLGVEVRLGGSLLRIANIYIPPASSCPTGYSPSFDNLRNARGDYLIMGDFNAHHPSWYSRTEDDRAAERGESLDAAISMTELCFLNEDSPTRLPSGPPSSPDVTLISGHLLLDSTWSTHTTLGSDHLPILTRLPGLSTAPRRARSYVNFLRADWEGFEREAELLFSSLGPPPSHARRGKKSSGRSWPQQQSTTSQPATKRISEDPGSQRQSGPS